MMTNYPTPEAGQPSEIDIATVRVELYAALRRAREVLEHAEIQLLLAQYQAGLSTNCLEGSRFVDAGDRDCGT
jgi:hypothetical protein